MKHIKLFEEFSSTLTEASLSGIEFGNDDGIHPTKFKPLVQSLKKNSVKMEVEKEEGMHGYPEVKLTGKRKDIEKVLADIWGPDSIDDHEDAFESLVNEAKFKKGQYIKAKIDSDDFDGDVYDKTNDVDGSEILKNSSFEIYEIGKDEVILWSDADEVEYSIDPDDLKNFVKESLVTESEAENILQDLLDERGGDMGELHGMEMEDALDTVEAYGHKGSKAKKIAKELHSLCNESVVSEAVNASGYIKAGKLGYNDQFLGRRSLSWTLSVDLGLKASDEFVGPWLGFDHVSLYAIGKKGGTILDDALTGKYTYDELKAAAAKYLGL